MTTPRTFTPDVKTVNDEGRTVTTIRLKRCCNGCGEYVGDADNRDVDKHGELTDVRAECPNCAPVVELEQAGCKTWQVNLRTVGGVARDLDRDGVFTKGYTQYVGDKLTTIGLRVGIRPGHVVARFGDWIIRHPDGGFTVHAGPQDGGQA